MLSAGTVSKYQQDEVDGPPPLLQFNVAHADFMQGTAMMFATADAGLIVAMQKFLDDGEAQLQKRPGELKHASGKNGWTSRT